MQKISGSLRKVAVAALVAAGLCGAAGQAEAARGALPSVELNICNKSNVNLSVQVTGTNQNGDQGWYPASNAWIGVPAGKCDHSDDYWFAIGYQITVTRTAGRGSTTFTIPANAKNGSTQTVNII